MEEYEFDKISVTDIARKAGVGRATFYRYFKCKEDIIVGYFERYKKQFLYGMRLYPRCREDYIQVVTKVLATFKEHMEQFKLIRKARLEYIYLDYLNKHFNLTFKEEYPEENGYAPYCYAGMLFNVSMAWLDGGCRDTVETLAESIVNAIYFD